MNRDMKSAEEKILDNGFEDVIILKDFSYDSALIGVSDDKMVEWLMLTEGFNEIEAIEWIEVNTLRALPYIEEKSPIVMHKLLE